MLIVLGLLAAVAHAESDVARGEYLVLGLGHCDACHSPRGLALQARSDALLQGGWVNGWVAPAINASALQGWSIEQLVTYLRSGEATGNTRAAGPMAEVIDQSLSRLTEADLRAIATYLKQLPGPAPQPPSAPAQATLALGRGEPRAAVPDALSAAQLFDAHCASCHHGGARGLPGLDDPGVSARRAGANLVMVILQGVQRGGDTRMPGFAQDLSDRQVATLANGLAAPAGAPLSAADVARRRRGDGHWGWRPLESLVGAAVLLLVAGLAVHAGLGYYRRRQPV